MMKRIIVSVLAGAGLLWAFPAVADLPKGSKAPAFATKGALAGKPFAFNLRLALAKGPVVLYFYPKAFTKGCTLEANAFAQAMPDFEAAGATVIGLSVDDLPTLQRFSRLECRDAFPVAIATDAVVEAYDAGLVMDGKDTGMTKRVSYVIGQDGKIVLVHSAMEWSEHVSKTLAAVRALTPRG